MNKDYEQLVGICGIYCGTCNIYLASKLDDKEELKKISARDNIPIQEIHCDGCLSDSVYSPCRECGHGFRECAKEKKVTWCFQCTDFPCQRLKSFKDIHIVNGISHHEHLIEDLAYMKDHGVGQWVEQQEKKGQCPKCGKMRYWFSKECPDCHVKIR